MIAAAITLFDIELARKFWTNSMFQWGVALLENYFFCDQRVL